MKKLMLLMLVLSSVVLAQTIKPGSVVVPAGSAPKRIIGVKCEMFKTHDDAQRYYLYWKSKGKTPKTLDRDKDGSACDCLPGGPKFGTKSCNKAK
jgi:hypothetical protein